MPLPLLSEELHHTGCLLRRLRHGSDEEGGEQEGDLFPGHSAPPCSLWEAVLVVPYYLFFPASVISCSFSCLQAFSSYMWRKACCLAFPPTLLLTMLFLCLWRHGFSASQCSNSFLVPHGRRHTGVGKRTLSEGRSLPHNSGRRWRSLVTLSCLPVSAGGGGSLVEEPRCYSIRHRAAWLTSLRLPTIWRGSSGCWYACARLWRPTCWRSVGLSFDSGGGVDALSPACYAGSPRTGARLPYFATRRLFLCCPGMTLTSCLPGAEKPWKTSLATFTTLLQLLQAAKGGRLVYCGLSHGSDVSCYLYLRSYVCCTKPHHQVRSCSGTTDASLHSRRDSCSLWRVPWAVAAWRSHTAVHVQYRPATCACRDAWRAFAISQAPPLCRWLSILWRPILL